MVRAVSEPDRGRQAAGAHERARLAFDLDSLARPGPARAGGRQRAGAGRRPAGCSVPIVARDDGLAAVRRGAGGRRGAAGRPRSGWSSTSGCRRAGSRPSPDARRRVAGERPTDDWKRDWWARPGRRETERAASHDGRLRGGRRRAVPARRPRASITDTPGVNRSSPARERWLAFLADLERLAEASRPCAVAATGVPVVDLDILGNHYGVPACRRLAARRVGGARPRAAAGGADPLERWQDPEPGTVLGRSTTTCVPTWSRSSTGSRAGRRRAEAWLRCGDERLPRWHPAQPSDLVDVGAPVTAYYTASPTRATPPAGRVRHLGPPRQQPRTPPSTRRTSSRPRRRSATTARSRGTTARCSSDATPTPSRSRPGPRALEVLAANDVTVLVDDRDGYTPTPAVSHAILRANRGKR